MKRDAAYKLDTRTAQQLHAEIGRLSSAFTPEWKFDVADPDIGSVIGLVFAAQMADNITRLNSVLGKYHTEFVNMLDLSPLPAYPAGGVVVMDLIEDTVPGVDVPRGTRLLSYSTEGTDPISFETLADVHLTGARARDIFMASALHGKLIPLRGDFEPPALYAPAEAAEPEAEAEAGLVFSAAGDVEAAPEAPMRLFDFGAPGIQQNALLLYHNSAFDTADGVDILLRLAGPTGEALATQLADPAHYRWLYPSGGQLVPFDAVQAQDGVLHLAKQGEMDRARFAGEDYGLVCLQATGPVTRHVELGTIGIASQSEGLPAEYVYGGGVDLEPGRFMPFGDTVSLFDECYIGHDEVFNQQGATIRLSFDLSVRTKLVTMTPEQEEAELKVVKRRVYQVPFTTVDTAPQRITFEYYNGVGWHRLPMSGDFTALFDGGHGGHVELSFACPDDWAPMAVGYEGRSLRIRVVQADNCYLQPCRHAMPLIENLQLAYAYEGRWRTPQRLRRLCGTEFSDLTVRMMEQKPLTAFLPLPYADNAVYIGFDRRIESGPASLLFDLGGAGRYAPAKLRFEYSTQAGFEPLKNVVDNTDGLLHTGTVVFMPPQNFAPRQLEGRRRWWLRIVDEGAAAGRPGTPVTVRALMPNAVGISNTETLDEELFYVTAAVPGMRFPLAARQILSAEVFVCENHLSAEEMRRMLVETPGDVRAEYDSLGEIIEFFVRWREVEHFDDSAARARHYIIDRLENSIRFGNGVDAALPPVRDGVSFTVRCTCCNGSAGNLPAGAVDSFYGNILYVDSVHNPAPTSAGSDMETLERAHIRGANIIASKNRLVSESDFEREVLASSAAIHRVRCVIGQDPQGRRLERLVSVAVLMQDYLGGNGVFEGLCRHLQARLLARCEATLDEESLVLCEPQFVTLTVEVWVRAARTDESFAARGELLRQLEDYIDPVRGNWGGGWEIGTLPTELQISKLLHSVQSDATVRRFMVTARYTDRAGEHECELDRLPRSPFMLAVNGAHRVHFTDD